MFLADVYYTRWFNTHTPDSDGEAETVDRIRWYYVSIASVTSP